MSVDTAEQRVVRLATVLGLVTTMLCAGCGDGGGRPGRGRCPHRSHRSVPDLVSALLRRRPGRGDVRDDHGRQPRPHVEDRPGASYRVLEAVDVHPEGFDPLTTRFHPDSAQFRRVCGEARRGSARAIAGRNAVGYACSWDESDMSWPQLDEVLLDETTGVLLEYTGYQAQEVVVDPAVDSSTFSTTPPDGAVVDVVKATGKRKPWPDKGSGLSPEAELLRIAASTSRPVYYPGADSAGVALWYSSSTTTPPVRRSWAISASTPARASRLCTAGPGQRGHGTVPAGQIYGTRWAAVDSGISGVCRRSSRQTRSGCSPPTSL